jgi:hypothetical protein
VRADASNMLPHVRAQMVTLYHRAYASGGGGGVCDGLRQIF